MTSAVAIILFVASLVLAIMLHELGHLLTAKRFGMRADRFFLGFGPTLWSTRRGETEYGVKALPLGGFVRIQGMTPYDERLPSVPDQIFTADALTGDRQTAGQRSGRDPLEVGNLPEPTWERLTAELRARGTPRSLAERIVRRTRANLPDHPTAADARAALTEVIATEVSDSNRVGDLHHRLLSGDEGRFFHDRPAWQRAITLVTGPLTHVVIAFAALAGAYLFIPQATGEALPLVDQVLPDSPAAEAGLEPGDRLLAVEGVHSEDYAELREAIRARPEVPIELVVERDGEQLVLDVTPIAETDPDTGETFGLVGFVPVAERARHDPVDALELALIGEPTLSTPGGGVVPMVGASVQALGQIFSPQGLGSLAAQATGQEERDLEGAMSLVGAANLAGQTGDGPTGVTVFLVLLAAINVFFFIFNLVPLPPFDGGHLAVLGIESVVNGVRRLRGLAPDFTVDPRAITAVALPVIAILLLVVVATLWLDITDPIRF